MGKTKDAATYKFSYNGKKREKSMSTKTRKKPHKMAIFENGNSRKMGEKTKGVATYENGDPKTFSYLCKQISTNARKMSHIFAIFEIDPRGNFRSNTVNFVESLQSYILKLSKTTQNTKVGTFAS